MLLLQVGVPFAVVAGVPVVSVVRMCVRMQMRMWLVVATCLVSCA